MVSTVGWFVQGDLLERNKPWTVSLALASVMGLGQNQIAPSCEEVGPGSDWCGSWLSPIWCHHQFILDVLCLWRFLMSLNSGRDSWVNYPCPDPFSYSYNGAFNPFCGLKKASLWLSQQRGNDRPPSLEAIQGDTWFLEQLLSTQACVAQWLWVVMAHLCSWPSCRPVSL